MVQSIWGKLEEINHSCFPPFAPSNKYVPWWTPELNYLRKQVNTSKCRVKRCKNPTLKDTYNTRFQLLRNNYKRKLLKSKQESWESTKESPWKLYKSVKTGFTRKPLPSTLTRADDSSTKTDGDTAIALLNQFFPDDLPEHDSPKQTIIRTQSELYEAPGSHPEPDFTNEEFENIVTNLKRNKYPGPDGLDGEIVKKMQKLIPNLWPTLFNKCLLLGHFPEIWKHAEVIAIPRADKSKHNTISGYRVISLLSVPGKCVEKLAMNRLNFFLENTKRVPVQQYGFIAGKSTTDAIKTVISFVRRCKQFRQKCCLLALDIVGAFDNAWHPSIISKLWNWNCPPNIFNILRSFLQDRTSHFTLGNATTSKMVTKGCPQGPVSGPTLWNIIISGLIEQLQDIPHLEIVIYADDIMIMLQGDTHTQILTTLDEAIQRTEVWCQTNKLEISNAKTSIMPMFARKKDAYKNHPTIIAKELKVVTKMKYLGIVIDSKLDWYPHTQHLECKALAIRNSLVRCSKSTWGISYHNLMTIYRHAILPQITYASEIWYTKISKRAQVKLTQIQRSHLSFATKAYRTVSNIALQTITATMPIELELLQRNDIRHLSQGSKTNAIITEKNRIEIPKRSIPYHPRENFISFDRSGKEGAGKVLIYTDGSKTPNHVGAGVVAMETRNEIYTRAQRLHIDCTVFQAELCGIKMAVDWIQKQQVKRSAYAIHVDSRAALSAVANKNTTHPRAAEVRDKLINLNKATKITLHWIKGHSGVRGNERADHIAKSTATQIHNIEYNAIPISQGKQLVRDYYNKIWNATYINSATARHTKVLIPDIPHRLSISLWPNFILTQFLTNHGRFREYLFRMKIAPSPTCDCSERKEQTALHLLKECTLFSRERPAVFNTLPLPQIMKTHIHTTTVMNFIQAVHNKLQE